MRSQPAQLLCFSAAILMCQVVSRVESGSLLNRVIASYDNRNNIQLCGKRITEFLHAFCLSVSGNTNSFYSPGASGPTVLEPQRSPNAYPRHPSLPQRQENNGIQKKWMSRGITDECCQTPCSRNYLLKYCGSTHPHEISTTTTTTTAPPTQSAETTPRTTDDEENASSSEEKPYLIPLLLDIIYKLQQPVEAPTTQLTPTTTLSPATFHTYHPSGVVNVYNRLHSAGRLTLRDTYRKNGSGHSRSRHRLESDETRRDDIESDELTPQPHIVATHRPPTSWESRVKLVTDDWERPSFPISAGTNFADVSEFSPS